MCKKIFLALSVLICSQSCFANSCPSVNELKHSKLIGWKAFDSDDGKPLTPQRTINFKKDAIQFALAEWTTDSHHKNGAIHCYYHDKSGSNLEAYLASNNFLPENSTNRWYSVSGAMQCAAGSDKCAFDTIKLQQTQLARK